ncbi:MAG: tyrosine-type recombinase/integrase, partial [Sporichthyaceae bacterium]|nr:tyrosine-type recombinase/integrase [Sporichthyaceae bacterium]
MQRVSARYLKAATSEDGRRCRAQAVERFRRVFHDLDGWLIRSLEERLAAHIDVRSFVAFALVDAGLAVDAEYVVRTASQWGKHHSAFDPLTAATFRAEAISLGFIDRESDKMWAKLSQIAVIAGTTPALIRPDQYALAREAWVGQVRARWGHLPKSAATPLFGLDAVLFHRGQADEPHPRRRSLSRSVHEVDWDNVATRAPQLAATAQRYLTQLGISLRASSVACFDTTLRQLAGLLLDQYPDVTCVADVNREHIEHYKTWRAARPGYRGQGTLSKTTIGMRMGHLRIFFERIIEWDYDDAPRRNPVFAGDRPIKDKPLPKFLDDPSAAKLLTAARALPDEFERLTVEVLSRTGMRKGEFLGLTVDAVVQIGSAFWLRTPVGKMHTDRYIPLHPHLKTLLDQWLAQRPDWQMTDLLFTDRGRPIPQSRVDRAVQRAASAAGIGHVHPHQLRHTLATQAVNRGMSLEAIAALLGHKSLEMTMVYARIADRTVADEYFRVTEKVEALYDGETLALPAEDEGREMRKLRGEMHRRMLGNGYCARPVELDCHFESICESCTFFVTTIEFRP